MNQNEMTVFEHIDEIRKRLVWIVVFLFVAIIAGFFLAKPLITFLQNADDAAMLTMNAFRLTDPFKIYMQMIMVIALILTSPVVLYQLWAFISPGLYEKERRITLSYIPISVILFLGGLCFSYFVLFPLSIKFMLNLSKDLGIHQVIGINEYFQFLFQITMPFGFLFEMPIVILFLTRLGIVTPMLLGKMRKIAFFLLLVISGIITPPDVASQLIVMVPLYSLYEVSIIISKIGYKKVLEAERIQMEEDLIVEE
jgi:sec-independent protein translocase protein TatC